MDCDLKPKGTESGLLIKPGENVKQAWKISFVLNLCLAGCLIYFLANQRRSEGNFLSPAAAKAVTTVSPAAASAAPVSPRENSAPFRWNQLVSSNDYRAFVANLRAAGCPEPTVEDIVRGDAERAFYVKRRELNVDGTKPGPWSGRAQIQLVAYLLGETSAPAGTASTSTRPPAYPLILQDVDLNALGLSAEQQERVAKIRQEFIASVGGTDQNPSTPTEKKRWLKARIVADDELRGSLGSQGVINYDLAVQGATGQ